MVSKRVESHIEEDVKTQVDQKQKEENKVTHLVVESQELFELDESENETNEEINEVQKEIKEEIYPDNIDNQILDNMNQIEKQIDQINCQARVEPNNQIEI